MKRLLKTIALFLALAMALSVGALAADGDEGGEDGPRLVLHWLEGREDGWYFNEEDTDYWSDGTLAPGVDWWVACFIQDGEALTPVIPTGKGAAVTPLAELEDQPAIEDAPYAEYYVLIQIEGWEEAELTATAGGRTYTMAIPAELPLEGFYTRPEFTQDAFYTGSGSTAELEDRTIYFGSLRNDEEHGSHVTEVTAQGDADCYTLEKMDGGFWKITLSPEEEFIFVQLDLRMRDMDRNYWNENMSMGFRSTVIRMYMRGASYDEENKIYVPAENGFAESFEIHPGDCQYMVFCTTEGWDEEGNPINVHYIPAEELVFSEGTLANGVLANYPADIEDGDDMAPCYVELCVENQDADYSVAWGEYTMDFDSRLPEIGVYSTPEAAFDTQVWVGRYGPYHEEEASYIINVPRNGRVLKSIELNEAGEDNINDRIELEKYADGVYAFHLTAPLPENQARFTASLTWEDKNSGTWTEDGWEFWYEQYSTILASEEPVADGTGADIAGFRESGTPFGEVRDELSTSITLDAGEEKTVYLTRAYNFNEAEDMSGWMVYAAYPLLFGTSDEALVLTNDGKDATKYTLLCDEPGEYDIFMYDGLRLRFLNEDGEEMSDADFVKTWNDNRLGWWNYDNWKTGAFTVYNTDGEAVELPCEAVVRAGNPAHFFTVKVTVEGETRPISEIYSDITNESAWYVPAVRFVTGKGMMAGSNGEFSPGTETTGAQFVQIMYNIAGQPGAGSASFAGVTTQWYAAAVTWAAGQGLITDTGDAALDPTAAITREQLALILYNAEGRPEVGEVDLSAFSDADQISSWALDAVKWAVSEKVINGSGGKLDPTGTTPRSQVAQLLMNYYG